ncbi:MAG: hypothetical protein ABEK50_06990 [bacterium]
MKRRNSRIPHRLLNWFQSTLLRWALVLILVFIYVLGHTADIGSIYRYRLLGYENMVPAIQNMMQPELYPRSNLISRITQFARYSSPLYFGLLAEPLAHLFHPVNVMKAIGIILSLALFVLGTYPGRSQRDWIRRGLIFLFFLHIGIVMSPLPGNRKSFTVVFLLAGLLLDRLESPWGRFYVIALSAGIYPPTGLLLLFLFYAKTYINSPTNGLEPIRDRLTESIVSCSLFVGVLGPYLVSKFFFNTLSSGTNQIHQRWVSLLGTSPVNRELWVGSLGSLFRYRRMMVTAIILWGLVLVLYGICDRWRSRKQYWWLILGSFTLWILAHLMYPTLYQPNKYTKGVLQLIPLILIGDNLPAAYTKIRKAARRTLTRNLLLASAILGLVYYSTSTFCELQETGCSLPGGLLIQDRIVLTSIVVTSLFLGLAVLLRQFPRRLSLVAILLPVATMALFPHGSWFKTYR